MIISSSGIRPLFYPMRSAGRVKTRVRIFLVGFMVVVFDYQKASVFLKIGTQYTESPFPWTSSLSCSNSFLSLGYLLI